MFYRDRWLSFPCHHLHPSIWFPTRTLSTTGSSARSDLYVYLRTPDHPHVRTGKCLVFHIETPWMGDRLLELHASW